MPVFSHAHPYNDAAPVQYAETEPFATSVLPRLLGLVAGAVPTVIGLIAVARIDWSNNGIHAPAVTVAGMPFRPIVAIITLAVGLLALAAAATRHSESSLAMGVLLICVGLAIHFGDTTAAKWQVGDRMAWFAGLVGAGLFLSGLLMRPTRVLRRRVSNDGYANVPR